MTTLSTLILALLLLLWLALLRLNAACLRANGADWGLGWLNRLDGLNRLLCRYYHRLGPVALDLPEKGPAIVVSNHISGLDPMLMLAACHRPLRFIIAREQYDRWWLNWLFRAIGCIPVDREKAPEKALRAAIAKLREGEVVALFPHGKIHLDSEPPRRIKAGAVRLAKITGAPIIPLYISGPRRQGDVILPVFLRAQAVVDPRPPINPDEHGEKHLLELVERRIAPSAYRQRPL